LRRGPRSSPARSGSRGHNCQNSTEAATSSPGESRLIQPARLAAIDLLVDAEQHRAEHPVGIIWLKRWLARSPIELPLESAPVDARLPMRDGRRAEDSRQQCRKKKCKFMS
jgi:hypothetical protein